MHKMLLNLPNQLETDRLILRCYQAGDGPMYFRAGQRNREHLHRFEAGNAILEPTTEEQAETLVLELVAEWEARRHFFWGVFEKATGEFAGQVYIGPVSWEIPEFEVGYFADRDHAGHGYITEAVWAALGFIFNDLHARRASLNCSAANIRSQRIAERCGFTLEGHLRLDHRNPDGSLEDSLHYGLLREDYERTNSRSSGS